MKIEILFVLLENRVWTEYKILSVEIRPYQLILIAIKRILVYVSTLHASIIIVIYFKKIKILFTAHIYIWRARTFLIIVFRARGSSNLSLKYLVCCIYYWLWTENINFLRAAASNYILNVLILSELFFENNKRCSAMTWKLRESS